MGKFQDHEPRKFVKPEVDAFGAMLASFKKALPLHNQPERKPAEAKPTPQLPPKEDEPFFVPSCLQLKFPPKPQPVKAKRKTRGAVYTEAERNESRIKAYRKYYEANKEKCKERARKQYQDNKDNRTFRIRRAKAVKKWRNGKAGQAYCKAYRKRELLSDEQRRKMTIQLVEWKREETMNRCHKLTDFQLKQKWNKENAKYGYGNNQDTIFN